MLGAIIGGIAALGAAIIGAVSAKKNSERAYQTTIDAQERANELNQENWQKQQDYLSPSSQITRYQEAGLNPNLLYGQMSSSNASIGNVQPSDTSMLYQNVSPTADALSSISQSAYQYDQFKLQKQSVESQTELANASARKGNAEATVIENDENMTGSQRRAFMLQNWNDELDKNFDEAQQRKASLQFSLQQIENLRQTRDINAKNLVMMQESHDKEMQKAAITLKSQAWELSKSQALYKWELAYRKKQLEVMGSEISHNKALDDDITYKQNRQKAQDELDASYHEWEQNIREVDLGAEWANKCVSALINVAGTIFGSDGVWSAATSDSESYGDKVETYTYDKQGRVTQKRTSSSSQTVGSSESRKSHRKPKSKTRKK